MVEKEEKHHEHFALIAIVAIVAIVALVVLVISPKWKQSSQPVVFVDEEGNIVGGGATYEEMWGASEPADWDYYDAENRGQTGGGTTSSGGGDRRHCSTATRCEEGNCPSGEKCVAERGSCVCKKPCEDSLDDGCDGYCSTGLKCEISRFGNKCLCK